MTNGTNTAEAAGAQGAGAQAAGSQGAGEQGAGAEAADALPTTMNPRLVVVEGDATRNEINMKLPMTIGRVPGNTLVIAHPLVSRKHCQIFLRDDWLWIRDFESVNGTFVSDQRVQGESLLRPGDRVTIGPLTFVAVYHHATTAASSKSLAQDMVGKALASNLALDKELPPADASDESPSEDGVVEPGKPTRYLEDGPSIETPSGMLGRFKAKTDEFDETAADVPSPAASSSSPPDSPAAGSSAGLSPLEDLDLDLDLDADNDGRAHSAEATTHGFIRLPSDDSIFAPIPSGPSSITPPTSDLPAYQAPASPPSFFEPVEDSDSAENILALEMNLMPRRSVFSADQAKNDPGRTMVQGAYTSDKFGPIELLSKAVEEASARLKEPSPAPAAAPSASPPSSAETAASNQVLHHLLRQLQGLQRQIDDRAKESERALALALRLHDQQQQLIRAESARLHELVAALSTELGRRLPSFSETSADAQLSDPSPLRSVSSSDDAPTLTQAETLQLEMERRFFAERTAREAHWSQVQSFLTRHNLS